MMPCNDACKSKLLIAGSFFTVWLHGIDIIDITDKETVDRPIIWPIMGPIG